MQMFGKTKISSRIDAQGRLVVESTGEKSIVSWTPSTGAATYRRHTA